MDSEGDDADTYTLTCWEVLSGSSCYEAVVLLYYQPINAYATVLKYFPDLAEDYRRDRPLEFIDLDRLERMMEESVG